MRWLAALVFALVLASPAVALSEAAARPGEVVRLPPIEITARAPEPAVFVIQRSPLGFVEAAEADETFTSDVVASVRRAPF